MRDRVDHSAIRRRLVVGHIDHLHWTIFSLSVTLQSRTKVLAVTAPVLPARIMCCEPSHVCTAKAFGTLYFVQNLVSVWGIVVHSVVFRLGNSVDTRDVWRVEKCSSVGRAGRDYGTDSV